MADPFGTAGGTSAALQDMQRIAQTQGQQLSNQKTGMEVQEMQKMQQLVSSEAGNMQGKSPVEQMENMANLAMKSGMVSSGAKLATDAAGIRLKQAQTTMNQAKTLNEQASAGKAELDMVDKLLGGVNDQASWEAANSLFQSMTGKKSPFDGMEYDPVFVGHLKQSALSIKDKMDIAIKQMNADTARANEQSASSFREFRKGILNQDLDIRRDRENRLRKAGGKSSDVGVPVKSELDHSADRIKEEWPDLPGEEINNAAYSIASRARAIRKTTPGLSADEATERALVEAKSAGTFQTVNDTYKIFGLDTGMSSGKHTEFKRGGKGGGTNTGSPALLPANPDPSSLKKGQTYINSRGQQGVWNGSGFDPVGGAGDEGDEE